MTPVLDSAVGQSISEVPTAASPRRRRGRLARRVVIGATVTAGVLAIAAQPAFASWQPVNIGGTSVTLRDCYHPSKAAQPSQSCTAIATVPAGTSVHLICQHAGQNIGGDAVWDYVDTPQGQGYVSDYYVYTGYANYVPGVDYCSY